MPISAPTSTRAGRGCGNCRATASAGLLLEVDTNRTPGGEDPAHAAGLLPSDRGIPDLVRERGRAVDRRAGSYANRDRAERIFRGDHGTIFTRHVRERLMPDEMTFELTSVQFGAEPVAVFRFGYERFELRARLGPGNLEHAIAAAAEVAASVFARWSHEA